MRTLQSLNQNEKNNVKDHLDNDHQQTKPQQTVYWYECYLCGYMLIQMFL